MSFTITIKLLLIKIQAKEKSIYNKKLYEFHQKWREQRNESMNRNIMQP